MCKEFSGIRILNLRDHNICLLGSWLKRFWKDEGKLWKQVIDDKYNTSRPSLMYSNSEGAHNSLKGSCGLQRQLKWGLCKK
jgi:hypothetical protein